MTESRKVLQKQLKVTGDSGIMLYRSGGYYGDSDGWDKWIVATYGDSDYVTPGVLDFRADNYQEFDTLKEALAVFTRLAKALK